MINLMTLLPLDNSIKRKNYSSTSFAQIRIVIIKRIQLNSIIAILTLFFLSPSASVFAQKPQMPVIGPTIIPFYLGNLSVDSFMYYWGTSKNRPTPQVTSKSIAQLKRVSCFAACDYLSWSLTEQKPGLWDFSFFRDHAVQLHADGIKYNVFPWLHFPPKWFQDDPRFIPYKCLEHDQPLKQLSLWAPFTHTIYQTFYAQLAKAMGDQIDFIRLAMPSEYGEIGYPVGMTNWLVPQPHVHKGFWCGDPYARQSFRDYAWKRYQTLSALNKAWGTTFKSKAEIAFPSVTTEAVALCLQPDQIFTRVHWLDFMDWYNQSWTDFMVWSTAEVKRSFPGSGLPQEGKDLRTRKEIIVSLGYGEESPATGNDQSRHIAAMKNAGLSAQTPGDIGYFATRRVSTACTLYGVPYYTEPPGSVNRDKEVQRIWMDASNGSQVYFDYPDNMDQARDLFSEYKVFLNGHRSQTNIALLLPTTTCQLHTEWAWPPYLSQFSDVLRKQQDFEVIDERMIADGALSRFGIHLLVLANAEYLKSNTLKRLQSWVQQGGVLISLQTNSVLTIDGSEKQWKALAPEIATATNENETTPLDLKTIWKKSGQKIGKGYVLILSGGAKQMQTQADQVVQISENLAEFLPGGLNSCRIQNGSDGSLASLFTDRILYYNPTDEAITKTVLLRPDDFKGKKPEKYSILLNIKPHAIMDIPLK